MHKHQFINLLSRLLTGLALVFFLFSFAASQTMWTKYPGNPILTPGPSNSWEYSVQHSSVVFDGNLYHMYYSGESSAPSYDGAVGHATSPDGIVWEKDTLNNPVLTKGSVGSWDSDYIFSPSVLYDGSVFHMWYTAARPTNAYIRIGYATSLDGVTWEKYNDPATTGTLYAESDPVLIPSAGSWDQNTVEVPAVIKTGNTYIMWYHGLNYSFTDGIGRATSTDGINWTKDPLNPVLTSDPSGSWENNFLRLGSVVFDGSTYHMFYYAGVFYVDFRIGYAWSSDGISWTKYDDPITPTPPFALSDPVLTWGAAGSWDDTQVGAPWVILDTLTSTFKMWYTGADVSVTGIGFAASKAMLNVPGNFPTIQAAIDAASDSNIVLVEDGTYYENINFKGKAITVASRFLIDGDTSHIGNTIIDGSQPSHPDTGSVVYFISGEDTTSVLCGFTITGGSGTKLNGFTGIVAYGAGGILLHSGGKIIHNKITGNHISTNQVAGGAGLLVSAINPSNIIIEDNMITYNTSVNPTLAHGGGMVLRPRWPSGYIGVKNNVISNNSVTCTGTYKANGAGIGVSLNLPTAGTIIIENNVITDNELHCIAAQGAGIYVVYYETGGIITDTIPTPLIYNNIIKNNFSEDKGAGIGIWTIETAPVWPPPGSIIKPQPVIINNTIVNNSAIDGSGIFNFDSFPLLLNNILWNDISVAGSREIFNDNITYPEYSDHINDGNIYAYYSDIQNGWSGGVSIIDADPLFADTTDYKLSGSSPCIGSGIDSVQIDGTWYHAPPEDFGGNPRPVPVGSGPDMGAWESPLPDGVRQVWGNAVITFQLSQNYPNPFNPETKIEFSIPKSGLVTLKVYNILGEKVATLVSDRLSAGSYVYEWDASNLAGGVYLYRLQAGDYVETRKMVLMK